MNLIQIIKKIILYGNYYNYFALFLGETRVVGATMDGLR